MTEDMKEILITEQQIKDTTRELGQRISQDYEGEPLLVVCVLKGSFIFTADLLRAISTPCTVDFMSVSSYYEGTVSSGEIAIRLDLAAEVAGRHVIVAEDIVDTGRTLACLCDLLRERGALSVRICTLLNKPSRHLVPIEPDYCGFVVPDVFVVVTGSILTKNIAIFLILAY